MSEEVLRIPVRGLDLQCRVDGRDDGFPILLLHRGGSDATTWRWLTPSLAKSGFRTIAPDLRGHGGSSRSQDYSLSTLVGDIEAILDYLGVDRFAVIGHALGGYLGLSIAERMPERVTGLIIEDPPLPPRNSSTAKNDRAPLMRTLRSPLGRKRRGSVVDRAAVSTALAQLRDPDPLWWERLTVISAPALVLGGGKRSPVNQRLIVQVAHRLQDARWEVVPVGHHIHSSAKELFRHLTTPTLFKAAVHADVMDGFPDASLNPSDREPG